MDLSSFRDTFPEFAKTANERVSRMLALADLECDPAAYGAQHATAVGYLAAHLLAVSPYGQSARRRDAEQTTTYQQHFERLQTMAGCGPRVI